MYLLRPLVNILTTPFGQWCWCCVPFHALAHAQLLHVGLAKQQQQQRAVPPTPVSGYANETSSGGDRGDSGENPSRSGRARVANPKRSGGGVSALRGSSPTKLPKSLRSLMARATSALADLMSNFTGTTGGGGVRGPGPGPGPKRGK